MIPRCLSRGALLIRRMLSHCIPLAALLLLVMSAAPVRAQQTQEGVEVLPDAAEWDVLLLFQDGTRFQMDPRVLDPDFLETWNTPAYDGPEFRTGLSGPISYGGINLFSGGQFPSGTVLETPDLGSRGTLYLRTTLNLTGTLSNIRLQLLADDGFIIYLDGVRWFSQNMAPEASSAFDHPAAFVGDENGLSTASVDGEILPGLHTLHVSLHNANPTSSDLGFLLRIVGDLTLPPPPPPVPNPALAASPSPPSTDGTPRLLLSATGLDPAAGYIVEGSSDMTLWAPLGFFPAAEDRREFTLDVSAAAPRRFFKLTSQSP